MIDNMNQIWDAVEKFQSQLEIVLYFVTGKLALENLAIFHTRSVNFVAANPTGLDMANR